MKKNKRMIILVGVLLLLGGIALAYFVGRMLSEGTGAEVKVKTAQIESSTVTVKGELQFEEIDILPGHKNVSSISVTATGNNELIPYNLIWSGSNGLNTKLNYTVYKASTKLEVKASCSKVGQPVSGGIAYLEQCEISNIEKLGEPVSEGTIETGENLKEILVEDEFITSTSTGQVVYYYVVLEYPNLDEDQYEYDKGKGFDGEVTVEPSDAEPDIEILAAYIENDKGDYEETSEIPQEGYTIDQDRSMCSNDTSPRWEKGELILSSLTKSGTGCVLYFKKPSSKKTLAKLGSFTIVEAPTSYSSTDTDDHGNTLYSTEDNDGTSYFYRGAVKNNWVKFGTNDNGDKDIWWRIVRINGDGTIRLIYTGMYDKNTNPSPGNKAYVTGEGTLVAKNQTFTSSNLTNDNTYVGFYYGTAGTSVLYPDNHSNKTPGNTAMQLKEWYNGADWDAGAYGKYIDENAGFCNDRTKPGSSIHGSSFTQEGYGTKSTLYGAGHRILVNGSAIISSEQKPTLKCGQLDLETEVDDKSYERDLYTLKTAKKGNLALEVPVGLITMDEVIFAGGIAQQNNTGYYLYSNEYFWTMSPRCFSSSNAFVFYVDNYGQFYWADVDWTNAGVRPVINLRADVEISGKGLYNDPYTIDTTT